MKIDEALTFATNCRIESYKLRIKQNEVFQQINKLQIKSLQLKIKDPAEAENVHQAAKNEKDKARAFEKESRYLTKRASIIEKSIYTINSMFDENWKDNIRNEDSVERDAE